MKYLKTFLIIFFLLSMFKGITYSATPSPESIQSQIDDLKNKIASKVAELKLVEKRGVVGKVTDITDTQITLSDLQGNTRIIDVDEITKFYSDSSDSFGISDISKGSTIGVLGLYNKGSRRVLAREINELSSPPKIVFGGIGVKDSDNFEITVVKENNQKIVVEVEDVTKTYSYSDGTLGRSGFSKMEEGQTVIIVGFSDKQDPNKLLATRIMILPEIDLSSKIDISQPNPTIPPSTGSGVKLYPIK